MCIRDSKEVIETTERFCKPCVDYLEFINVSKVFLQLNDKNKKPGAMLAKAHISSNVSNLSEATFRP